MDALVIEGPSILSGKVKVSGSKNSSLPLIFSSLLLDSTVRFENVPRLWDIETTLKLLSSMGAHSEWNKDAGTLDIDPKIHTRVAPYEWVKRMRAGILALGPLVAKYGEAKVSLPGGCAIGARPVNFHIEALKLLGVELNVESGYIHATVPKKLKAAHIKFPQVTVTGTENLLFATAVAEGSSILENAACEPEVVALGEFLKLCGANIEGLGTKTIKVEGGSLKSPQAPFRIPSDRIEAGTWLSIAACTRNELEIEGFNSHELDAVISVFKSMGVKISSTASGSTLVTPQENYMPACVATSPYPGFPTDMQAQWMTFAMQASGRSEIEEKIFENRFMHVAELRRMGAKIHTTGSRCFIDGPCDLQGTEIMATDLRASASLVIAGLSAKGKTTISRIYHLDRGYQRLDDKLLALGAKIWRIKDSGR